MGLLAWAPDGTKLFLTGGVGGEWSPRGRLAAIDLMQDEPSSAAWPKGHNFLGAPCPARKRIFCVFACAIVAAAFLTFVVLVSRQWCLRTS